MSLSVSQTHSRAGSSDISDAVKTIVGRVNKKFSARTRTNSTATGWSSGSASANTGASATTERSQPTASLGAASFTLEEQAYLVQLMLETERNTGAVELCQTMLGDFQRTARTYSAQMSNLQQARNAISDADSEAIRMLQERVMVVLTKQRMLDIEIGYLENKIDLLQRRNRAFDEYNDRLVALYSSNWPKGSKKLRNQEGLERSLDETFNQLHKAEMSLERYILLNSLLMQGDKALEAAIKFVEKFKEEGGVSAGTNGMDNKYLNAMRMCTIQADVVMKQAKFVLPSLFKDQLNVEIFQDGWLSTVFRSDRIEDTTQTLTTFKTQHSAVKPLIEQSAELIKTQAEVANVFQTKYRQAILAKENWQRKVLYDSVLGPASTTADGGAKSDKDKEREPLYFQLDSLETRLDEIIDGADAHAGGGVSDGADGVNPDDNSVVAASMRIVTMRSKHMTFTGSLPSPTQLSAPTGFGALRSQNTAATAVAAAAAPATTATMSSTNPFSAAAIAARRGANREREKETGSINTDSISLPFPMAIPPQLSTSRAASPLGNLSRSTSPNPSSDPVSTSTSATPASRANSVDPSLAATPAIAKIPPTPIMTETSAPAPPKSQGRARALSSAAALRSTSPNPPRRPKRPPTLNFMDIDSFISSANAGAEVPPLPTAGTSTSNTPSLSPAPTPSPSPSPSVSPAPSPSHSRASSVSRENTPSLSVDTVVAAGSTSNARRRERGRTRIGIELLTADSTISAASTPASASTPGISAPPNRPISPSPPSGPSASMTLSQAAATTTGGAETTKTRVPTPLRALPLPQLLSGGPSSSSSSSPSRLLVSNSNSNGNNNNSNNNNNNNNANNGITVSTTVYTTVDPSPPPRSQRRPQPLPTPTPTPNSTTLGFSLNTPAMPLTPPPRPARTPSPKRIPPPILPPNPPSSSTSSVPVAARALPIPPPPPPYSLPAASLSSASMRIRTPSPSALDRIPVPPPRRIRSPSPAPPSTGATDITTITTTTTSTKLAVPKPIPFASLIQTAGFEFDTETEEYAASEKSSTKSVPRVNPEVSQSPSSPPPPPPPKPSNLTYSSSGSATGSTVGSSKRGSESNSSISISSQPRGSAASVTSSSSPDAPGPGPGPAFGFNSAGSQSQSSRSQAQPYQDSFSTAAAFAGTATSAPVVPPPPPQVLAPSPAPPSTSAPHSILKHGATPSIGGTATAPDSRVRKPSMDEWGTAKVAAASAVSKTKFKAMLNRFRTNSGDGTAGSGGVGTAGNTGGGAGAATFSGLLKRSTSGESSASSASGSGSVGGGGGNSSAAQSPAMAAAIAAGFISAPKVKSQQAQAQAQLRQHPQRKLSPRFVDDVEVIPRPDVDSYPYSSDEDMYGKDSAQPPSPSKRNSLLWSPISPATGDDEDDDDDDDEVVQVQQMRENKEEEKSKMKMSPIKEQHGPNRGHGRVRRDTDTDADVEDDEFLADYYADSPMSRGSQKSPGALGSHYGHSSNSMWRGPGRKRSEGEESFGQRGANYLHHEMQMQSPEDVDTGGFARLEKYHQLGGGDGKSGSVSHGDSERDELDLEDADGYDEHDIRSDRDTVEHGHASLTLSEIAADYYESEQLYHRYGRKSGSGSHDDYKYNYHADEEEEDDDDRDALRLGLTPGMRVGPSTPVPSYHERATVPSYHEREDDRDTETELDHDDRYLDVDRGSIMTSNTDTSVEKYQAFVDEMMMNPTSFRNKQHSPHPYANPYLTAGTSSSHGRDHTPSPAPIPDYTRAPAQPRQPKPTRPPPSLIPGKPNSSSPTTISMNSNRMF